MPHDENGTPKTSGGGWPTSVQEELPAFMPFGREDLNVTFPVG